MFDKLRKIKQLRELQDSLAKEEVEAEKRGTKVIINGKMKVEQIILNPELSREEQEKVLKNVINDAMGKVQLIAAQKMSQFSNLLS